MATFFDAKISRVCNVLELTVYAVQLHHLPLLVNTPVPQPYQSLGATARQIELQVLEIIVTTCDGLGGAAIVTSLIVMTVGVTNSMILTDEHVVASNQI